MPNDDEYVTRDECAAGRKEVITLVTTIHDDVKKHGKALYGDDGRGGVQKDVTEILTKLSNGEIKSSLTFTEKAVIAAISVSGSVIVALIANGALG